MREHNRVAGLLKEAHKDWNDEIIFQEARRITIAEYQHIIFNEFLPILVGERFFNQMYHSFFQRLCLFLKV